MEELILLNIVRHLEIPTKLTKSWKLLRKEFDSLREQGWVDDQNQITPEGKKIVLLFSSELRENDATSNEIEEFVKQVKFLERKGANWQVKFKERYGILTGSNLQQS